MGLCSPQALGKASISCLHQGCLMLTMLTVGKCEAIMLFSGSFVLRLIHHLTVPRVLDCFKLFSLAFLSQTLVEDGAWLSHLGSQYFICSVQLRLENRCKIWKMVPKMIFVGNRTETCAAFAPWPTTVHICLNSSQFQYCPMQKRTFREPSYRLKPFMPGNFQAVVFSLGYLLLLGYWPGLS